MEKQEKFGVILAIICLAADFVGIWVFLFASSSDVFGMHVSLNLQKFFALVCIFYSSVVFSYHLITWAMRKSNNRGSSIPLETSIASVFVAAVVSWIPLYCLWLAIALHDLTAIYFGIFMVIGFPAGPILIVIAVFAFMELIGTDDELIMKDRRRIEEF